MLIPQPAAIRPVTLREKRQVAGRLGGIQTSLRYGSDYMREIGRRGGQYSHFDNLGQPSPSNSQNNAEGGCPLTSTKGWKKACRSQIKDASSGLIHPGGDESE